ncbi:Os09g0455750 [Oryza sativa Japonica Group]|uniref:Os09g0455750 protein n=1 Tax=Oryza sativa subsp. japonica TaxID=39947 RepID=A0A0P0XMP6_ORYSJ|nr:Os09g0455750 [Oryza sativa Japonica Group]
MGFIRGSSSPPFASGKMIDHLFLTLSQNSSGSPSILVSPQNEGWSKIVPSMRAGTAASRPRTPTAMVMLWAMFPPALTPAKKTRPVSPCSDSHGSAPDNAQLSAAQESSYAAGSRCSGARR